jgi:N-acetylmuramoyl-L-alanine amidase
MTFRRGRAAILAATLLVATALPVQAVEAVRPRQWAGHGATPALTAAQLRPHIVQKHIPFPQKRKDQMAAYSKRHYGESSFLLTDPHVIVEHFTTSDSMQAAWNYFAANEPDLGQLPGVCSHFLIDLDGTIYQLVPLSIRCRHAVGLNDTAFGIEDVGTSDRNILNNKAMMRASLSLTLWLMAEYHIQVRNVIGHSESIYSPYHHELVRRWRCQTHSDWNRRDMGVYRDKLRALAKAAGVPVGPRPAWVHPRC